MWRVITVSIVTGSLLTGSALAQQAAAPPAAQPGAGAPVGAPPTAQQQEAQAKDEQRAAEALLKDQQRALEARKMAELRSAQAAEAAATVERDRAKAELDRLKAEQNFLAARRTRPVLARQLKKETVAYCGVSVSEPTPVLSEQLKLQPGTGLVVDFVVEKSPAQTAGVKQYDLLTRLDDQVLTNADQFRALIRMKKPGDDVKLAVVRRGEPTALNVELGQQEIEEEVGQATPNANNADPTLRKFDMMLGFDNVGNLAVTNPQALDFNVMGGGLAVTNVNGKSQAVWTDEKHVLTMQLGKDGKATHLTAKDTAGKQLFDGPVETDEQRKALPPDLAETLQKAEAGGPVQFKLNAARLTPPLPPMAGAMGGGGAMPAPVPVLRGYGARRVPGAPGAPGAPADGKPRARVLTSTEKDTLMLVRFDDKNKATWAFAFSELDGKTLFDGPTATDEQRKAMPEPIATQLEALEKNQSAAGEFGVVGRN